MRPQEKKTFGNQLQQIKTNQMITRSFLRQCLGSQYGSLILFRAWPSLGFWNCSLVRGVNKKNFQQKYNESKCGKIQFLKTFKPLKKPSCIVPENQSLQSLQSFSHKPPNQTPLPQPTTKPNYQHFTVSITSSLPVLQKKNERRFRESSRHLVDTRLHSKYFQSLLTSFDQVLCSIHHFV